MMTWLDLAVTASLLLHPVLDCLVDGFNPVDTRMASLVEACERQNLPAWDGDWSGASDCTAQALRVVAAEYDVWVAAHPDEARPCGPALTEGAF